MKLLNGICALGLLAAGAAQAETVANCGPQAGEAYYGAGRLSKLTESGWTKDEVSAGQTTLSKDAEGDYDVTFADVSGEVHSARKEGAVITRQRLTSSEITVIVAYPGQTVEIYQFVKDATGKREMVMLQNRGAPVPKGSLMVASCSVIDPK